MDCLPRLLSLLVRSRSGTDSGWIEGFLIQGDPVERNEIIRCYLCIRSIRVSKNLEKIGLKRNSTCDPGCDTSAAPWTLYCEAIQAILNSMLLNKTY